MMICLQSAGNTVPRNKGRKLLNELFGIRNKDIRGVSIISDVIDICSVLLYICGARVRGQAPVDYEAVYGGQHLVSTRNKGGVISL